MRRVLLATLAASGLWAAQLGCDTLNSVKGGADNLSQTADQAKDQTDKGKDETAKAKDKKKGGGGGGGGGGSQDEDGDRLHAKESMPNVPLDDSVDNKQDPFDWRKFYFGGKPGLYATFELHWDDQKANLDVDVYNQLGDRVGISPPKLEGRQAKKLLLQIDEPGVYYVRVSAPGKTDASIYTLVVKYTGPSTAPASAQAPSGGAAAAGGGAKSGTATGAGTGAAAATAPAAPPTPTPLAQDPTKLLGSIVQAHREGSDLILYLDRGSQQHVREGMTGNILDGPDGDKLLDGATFTVSQVIDGNKSIARSSFAKSTGKNRRIVLNLK